MKFELDPADAGKIRRYLAQIAKRRGQRKLTSVYYDTPDFRLRRAGVTLRVRRSGRRLVQTIKAESAQAGLFDRPEWEREIKGLRPDLSVATDTPVQSLLNGQADSLRPVFQTRVRRTIYRLARHGSRIEVALDQGEVDTGRDSTPICELELELTSGDAASLFDLAREVIEVGSLHPSARSKPDRGYELLGNGAGAPETKTEIHLGPDSTTSVAFRTIARACMSQLAANEEATLARNAEALHQMRVAIRRLRAAISVFSEIVADQQNARIKGELKWIAGTLGSARDADVFISEALAPLRDSKPDDPGIAWLLHRFEEARAQAYEKASEAIRSQRYRKMVIDVLEWIEAGAWAQNGDDLRRLQRDQPVELFAADELSRRHRKVRKGGTKLRRLGSEKQHKLRIRAKKLRYAMEFFTDVFPGKKRAKRCKQGLSALRSLQDALGALNDVATREKLASEAALSSNGAASKLDERKHAFAAGLVLGNQEALVPSARGDAEHALAKFRKVKPFWA